MPRRMWKDVRSAAREVRAGRNGEWARIGWQNGSSKWWKGGRGDTGATRLCQRISSQSPRHRPCYRDWVGGLLQSRDSSGCMVSSIQY